MIALVSDCVLFALFIVVGFIYLIAPPKKEQVSQRELVEQRREQCIEENRRLFLAGVPATGRTVEAGILRSRVEYYSNFEAYQVCPACNQQDFHRIKEASDSSFLPYVVIRQCNNCDFEWRQK